MARGPMISIDEKIKRQELKVAKVKEKLDQEQAALKELQIKRDAQAFEELKGAMMASGKTTEEIMAFLKS
ncbi:MAG: ErpK protein [Lachnospiraceae bacterium]|nr:ErpK protein [Lachnospiraceae bacterium]